MVAYAVSHYLPMVFLVATVICLGGVSANMDEDGPEGGGWAVGALVFGILTILFGG